MTTVSLGLERAKRTNDNTTVTPAECCEDAAADLRSGERKASKLLILTLDTEDGGYVPGWYAANLSASEMLALMEVARAVLLREMGF